MMEGNNNSIICGNRTGNHIFVYKRRWFILFVVCLTNFANNMAWISFAPISSYTVDFYGNENAPMLLNVIFMICAPVGFVSMWAIGRHGLRLGCLLGAWLNLMGTLLRLYAASVWFPSAEWRFVVTLGGQTLAACAQPFVMYLPAKLAAAWFPDSQRVLANSLASLSNPLGAATIYALAPQIVNGTAPRAFFQLNGIVAGMALVGAISSLGVTSSRPPTPPSTSANAQREGHSAAEIGSVREIWHGICMSFRSKAFIILALGLGSGFGLFNALYNNLQPALCSKGYSNAFSGSIGAGMIVAGLMFSAVFGVFVDRTRLFEETMKACMCATSLAACCLMVLARFPGMELWVALSVLAFGAFSLSIYPIGLELGVETTFPAPEATSTGLLILTGQVFGVAYIFLTTYLKHPATPRELAIQTCSSDDVPIGVYDWKYSFIVWNAILVITATLFTFTFWPKYRRMEYEANENRVKFEQQQER